MGWGDLDGIYTLELKHCACAGEEVYCNTSHGAGVLDGIFARGYTDA